MAIYSNDLDRSYSNINLNNLSNLTNLDEDHNYIVDDSCDEEEMENLTAWTSNIDVKNVFE